MDIESVLPNRDFPDYTPFSPSCNPLYFEFAIPYLKNRLNEECPLYACQIDFEELVGESYELQMEYIEHYHHENEYFLTQGMVSDILMEMHFVSR